MLVVQALLCCHHLRSGCVPPSADRHAGSLQPSVVPEDVLGAETFSMIVGDFNSDHKPDVVVAVGGNTFAYLQGKGDGTFTAPV
jgi:hypothetical protein